MSDPEFAPAEMQAFLLALFAAYGTPADHAAIVVDHLLDSSACGLPSHGVLRVADYLDAIESGKVDAAAEPRVVGGGGVLVLDAQNGFGQVAAARAVHDVARHAREHGTAVVALRRAGHLGRIGAYAEALARDGFVAIAFCSVPTRFHNVAWFGARDGRMGTNPIAYAFPTEGDPVVADFSTSATPEGRIRLLRNQDRPVPQGILRDAEGRPTTDPNVLYDDPGGTIQPLGGDFGHKGSALGMLAEVMGTLLADEDVGRNEHENNLTLVALTPGDGFRGRASRYTDYIHAAAPIDPARPLLVPGEPEAANRRRATSVVVDATSWSAIAERAARKRVDVPATRS